MRRKIVKATKDIADQARQIITFDNAIYGHILVEQPAVNKSLNLNKEVIKKQANILRLSAVNANTACLTSKQIGSLFPLIAIYKHIDYDAKQNRMSWINQKYEKEQDFKIYHDAIITKGSQLAQEHQESISFPFFHFKVQRYNQIHFIHRNGLGQRVQEVLIGPSARALQQGIDQLEANVLLDWRINHGNISFLEQAVKHFPKTYSTIEEYTSDLKKLFTQYPKLIEKVPTFESHNESLNPLHQEVISFEGDYYRRIVKYYSKEMQSLQQRIRSGTVDVDFNQQSKQKQKHIKVKKIKK